MKRLTALAAITISLAVVPTADAATLSKGEFARAIGGAFLNDFKFGATRGSLYLGECRRVDRAGMKCYLTFDDADGDGWCGKGAVRDVGSHYRVGWNVKRC